MGREETGCEDLFSYDISLKRRARANHPLRRIKDKIDFKAVEGSGLFLNE
jgi:hypothetical protein